MTPSPIPPRRLLQLCGSTISASPLISQSPQASVFDYVIVGSGPGGLVVANRLTEIPGVSGNRRGWDMGWGCYR